MYKNMNVDIIMRDMNYAIQNIRRQAGQPGTNSIVEFLAKELATLDERVSWADLSTLERTLLRFAWEFAHRTTCPLHLHPASPADAGEQS